MPEPVPPEMLCVNMKPYVKESANRHFQTVAVLCLARQDVHRYFAVGASLLETHSPVVASSISIRAHISNRNEQSAIRHIFRIKEVLILRFSDTVNDPWLQIKQYGTRDEVAIVGLSLIPQNEFPT